MGMGMGMGMYYRIACFFAYLYIEYIPDCNCCNNIIIIILYPTVSSTVHFMQPAG